MPDLPFNPPDPRDLPPTLLWVDDDADVRLAAGFAVRPLAARLLAAAHPREVPALLAANPVDVVVLDLNFTRGATDGAEGLACLEAILAQDADAAVVVASAYGDVELAVAAMRRGAIDFITKPWTDERLLATLRSACRLRRTRREAREQGARLALLAGGGSDDDSALLGDSAPLRRVRELIALAAPTEANVLLLGENGTGKELAARALHRQSRRAGRPFVSVDLGALSASVFDSELFGHKRGAFTDAKADRIGRLQAAEGGTLFLDEIGNLPLALQPKLLTALEQRRITPLGSNAQVRLDLRVLTATNLPRARVTDEAVFRRDLLYRLNTIEIELPPLRERREDIVPLAEHYLRLYERKYGREPRPLAAAATRALMADAWPGNVRALRHAAERAVILAQGRQYAADDFALAGAAWGVGAAALVAVPGPVPALAPASPTPAAASTAPSPPPPPMAPAAAPNAAAHGEDADLNIERSERTLVERALRKHRWNVAQAARELGLSRAALYRRMERYGL